MTPERRVDFVRSSTKLSFSTLRCPSTSLVQTKRPIYISSMEAVRVRILGFGIACLVGLALAGCGTGSHEAATKTTPSAGTVGPGVHAGANKPPFWFSQCEHMIDGGLAAGACSQSQLEAAVQSGRMTEPGAFSIAITGRRTATAPGVVQVIGGPVRPGTVASFNGKPAKDEVIVLNCFVGGREYAIKLGRLRLKAGASARLAVRNGKPFAKVTRLVASQVTLRYQYAPGT
jgi:hypothetical protein